MYKSLYTVLDMINTNESYISIAEHIARVQEVFPDFSRQTLTSWQQRHRFPKAILGKSAGGAGPTEGFFPVQLIEITKYLLRRKADGLQLKAAFSEIDQIVLDALQDTVDPDNSKVFNYYAALDEANIKMDEVTSILESAGDEPPPTEIAKAVNQKLREVKSLLTEYYLLRCKAETLRESIPIQVRLFDGFASFHDFCRLWGAARDHYLILKLVEQEDANNKGQEGGETR